MEIFQIKRQESKIMISLWKTLPQNYGWLIVSWMFTNFLYKECKCRQKFGCLPWGKRLTLA